MGSPPNLLKMPHQCKSGRELDDMLRLLTLTLIFKSYVFIISGVLKSNVILAASTTSQHHILDIGPNDDYGIMMTNSCWSSNECLISAKLYFNSGYILPIKINCSVADNLFDESINSIIVNRRYENISSVTLDGCGTALNVNTFGFEYIPNCNKIATLNLENFHFDEIYEIICVSGVVLENVRFIHNEFSTLSATGVSNLKNLKTLTFVRNNLRHMQVDTFNELEELREIRLVEEVNLRIRYANIFENLHRLQSLLMSGIDEITGGIFQHLPVNLDNLTINKAKFDSRSITVKAPVELENLTLTNCDLTSLTIMGQDKMRHLNLSSNSLSQLFLENCTLLRTLDLSSNNLSHIPEHQFKHLHHLDRVYLQRNHLKSFSVLMFLNSLSHIQTIDLRTNDLKFIQDVTTDLLTLNTHLHIIIDGNPWNCLWLVNVSYNLPEQYRVFRYEKFISKINVNGLECMTYPPDMDSLNSFPNEQRQQKNSSSTKYTITYAGPREVKRNQKAEALVIVFMLPVGIAFLFVLLYLWINCQKVFHLSYYRNLPLVRNSAERFDVVRQLPPSGISNASMLNQGYEIPVAGCKCTGHPNKICCKLNVAYEDTAPHQHATKVYEEIIEYTGNSGSGNCYYDRLNRE